MAPLTDDVPSPVSAQPRFDFPDPAAQPTQAFMAAPPVQFAPAPPPAIVPPPQAYAPARPQLPVQSSPPPPVQPAPTQPPTVPLPSFTVATSPPPSDVAPFALTPSATSAGPGVFALERHQSKVRSGNGVLDWIAFALAFLAPPIGLLVGIGAAVTDSRNKGYVASIAKAAIGIGAALSLVLGVVFVVVSKIDSDQAAHNAIVASSRTWCTKLKANPTTLASDTFGWPSPGNTIPASITAMKAYETSWKSLVVVAPVGIRSDTQKVETAAASIVSSVQSTGTLDDASNVAQMQNVVAASGIQSWVSTYCK
jgi:hypothetical protein